MVSPDGAAPFFASAFAKASADSELRRANAYGVVSLRSCVALSGLLVNGCVFRGLTPPARNG